jgi:hypothetical protein
VRPGLEARVSRRAVALHHPGVVEGLPDDTILIMEVLFDIRRNTDFIIDLLLDEEDDEQEEEANDS